MFNFQVVIDLKIACNTGKTHKDPETTSVRSINRFKGWWKKINRKVIKKGQNIRKGLLLAEFIVQIY